MGRQQEETLGLVCAFETPSDTLQESHGLMPLSIQLYEPMGAIRLQTSTVDY